MYTKGQVAFWVYRKISTNSPSRPSREYKRGNIIVAITNYKKNISVTRGLEHFKWSETTRGASGHLNPCQEVFVLSSWRLKASRTGWLIQDFSHEKKCHSFITCFGWQSRSPKNLFNAFALIYRAGHGLGQAGWDPQTLPKGYQHSIGHRGQGFRSWRADNQQMHQRTPEQAHK